MLNTLLSISPIFLLIVSGCLGKKYFLPDESFWKVVDKLVYYLFFPALLVLDISQAHFNNANIATAITATIGATLAMAFLILLGQWFFAVKNDLFTSIFQGGVRYNSYVFLALSQSLYGAEGTALSGVFVTYMIILTNIISVLVMNHYGNGGKKTLAGTVLALTKNPLILGALLGLCINLSGISIPGAIQQLLAYFGHAATPLSLMSVGAGLTLRMQVSQSLATAYAVTLKLLLMPVFTILLLKLQGVSGVSASIALLYSAAPCAGNAYILARQMGGDPEAMASIITWTTLLSSITITLFMGNIFF